MKKWTRLIEARKANHLTQIEMAAKCGVSQGTYTRWELLQFEPSIKQLKTISLVLSVPVDYLIYNDQFDVGDLDYWMQLKDVKNAYNRLLAEHPGGLGMYQTKEELLDFIGKYAPGPYSINPDELEGEGDEIGDNPWPASIFENK